MCVYIKYLNTDHVNHECFSTTWQTGGIHHTTFLCILTFLGFIFEHKVPALCLDSPHFLEVFKHSPSSTVLILDHLNIVFYGRSSMFWDNIQLKHAVFLGWSLVCLHCVFVLHLTVCFSSSMPPMAPLSLELALLKASSLELQSGLRGWTHPQSGMCAHFEPCTPQTTTRPAVKETNRIISQQQDRTTEVQFGWKHRRTTTHNMFLTHIYLRVRVGSWRFKVLCAGKFSTPFLLAWRTLPSSMVALSCREL